MKILLGSDHAGFEVKNKIISYLKKNTDFEIEDVGCSSEERVDYPDFANEVCSSVLRSKDQKNTFGILVCGSGQGMAMRANKYKDIRAALCWSEETARLSRNHNDANVLCLGARVLELNVIEKIVTTFLQTDFEGGRHKKRTEKIGYNTII